MNSIDKISPTSRALFGQSTARYGVASQVAVGLAFACWPLMVVIGFPMVFVAFALALVAAIAGVLGEGTGIYYQVWLGIVGGLLGLGLVGLGGWWVAWSVVNF